jgi:hypothetical protein
MGLNRTKRYCLVMWIYHMYCTVSAGSYTAKTQYRNSKQIFPEKELCGLSSNFHIHVSVSDFYNPRIGLRKNMWTDPENT